MLQIYKSTFFQHINNYFRMIKWSDGSMSLHLGSEVFDVHKQPLQSDYNHLFIRQGTGIHTAFIYRTSLVISEYFNRRFQSNVFDSKV